MTGRAPARDLAVWLKVPVLESVARLVRDHAVVVMTGERLLLKTIAGLAVMMTDVHKDLAMIADGEIEMSATIDDAADQGTPTLAVVSLEYHAVPNVVMIGIARHLVHDPEEHIAPANGPLFEVVVITLAQGVPITLTVMCLEEATSAMIVEPEDETIVVTESEVTVVIASVTLVDTADVRTVVIGHVATGPESTIAGMQEMEVPESLEKAEVLERPPSEVVDSKTLIATYLAMLAETTRIQIVKGSENARREREVGVEAETEIETEREILEGVVVDQRVEIEEAEGVIKCRTVASPPQHSSRLVLLLRYNILIRSITYRSQYTNERGTTSQL